MNMPSTRTFKYAFTILLALNLLFLCAVISYQVTLKGETVTVPDLTGIDLTEAKSELERKSLSLVQEGFQLHPSLERGKIISQTPSPDARIKPNAGIRVMVSAGKETTVVPDLTAKNHQNIGPLLDEAGVRKGKISYVYTPKLSAGKILAQYPLAQTTVPRDDMINLLVSQGDREDKFLMPDLIGKRASRVMSRLRELGFSVRDVSTKYYPGLESGVIIKQFPPQGFRIQKRDRITLEVSK